MVVKAKKKIPELKIKDSNTVNRAMANPLLRFLFAGIFGLFITLLLFLFMMYISDNFVDSSGSTSETIFTLQTIVLEDEDQRPDRVQKPADLVDLMEGGDGLVDSQQAYENDEIPVEDWRRMFPGQLINEGNTNEETQQ